MMISVLNRIMKVSNKYICVSRPRRFGKTIACNMLSAYFSKGCDSRNLFEKYKISNDPSFETNLNKLNVIKIDMNSEFKNELDTENLLNNLQERIVAEFIEQFSDINFNPKESVGNCIL
ncbi:MAG: AAA family ATPase [Treponema sp.]|nr:AAA family ATPase [Treponema sp.]